ncbi:MAG: hypothetical protein JWO36_4633 [Myxococcales bacterium]|nr:hypothetical protein [Myxococcales bacterium]
MQLAPCPVRSGVTSIQSKMVQTADLNVHYLAAGEGGGLEPIVLLHGFPETSHSWRHQLPVLGAAGHPTFAIDSRGFGKTDKPRVRTTRAMLGDDVVRFLDALDIDRAMVVGHDWGGIIAFKATIDHPERVSRVALLDTLCTVWSRAGAHGYWFKAEPLPEQFLAAHARAFIEVLFASGDPAALGTRPASPYGELKGKLARPDWVDDEALAHYIDALADPDSQAAAIQYFRYALPFHRVTADPSATHGERFESLSERDVAAMWLHPHGLEQHPGFQEYYDFGPEDRHKRSDAPALWMYSKLRGHVPRGSVTDDATIPTGNPYLDQFSRYFADLRVRAVDCGHFIPEEAPEYTSSVLLEFAAGTI